MNPRHAAALALVGWYLIVPPLNRPRAAMGEWTIFKSFDSADLCQAERDREVEWAAKGENSGKYLTLHTKSRNAQFDGTAAQCIASDDPRLKEK